MTFCHKCGKKLKKEENFCGDCGTKIKEFLEEIEEEAEEKVRKTNSGGLTVFIIFLIIVGYVALDIWAATQVRPEVSADSLLSSISNANGNVGLTSASGSTTIRLQNPTFVPVFLFPISYEAGYGSTQIAKGSTGIIFIPSYSTSDVSANVEISYAGVGGAVLNGIANLFTGNKQSAYVNFYELGIKIASYQS